MRIQKFKLFLIFVFAINTSSFAQIISPDSTGLATKQLTELKQQLHSNISNSGGNDVAIIQKMLDVGMWDDAYKAIKEHKNPTDDYQLLLADYFMLNNDFKATELIVNKVLKSSPQKEKAILLNAFLAIQAWRLTDAESICDEAIQRESTEDLQLMLGRVKLLQKKYPEALSIAKKIISQNPKSAVAYLLEADVHFWDQQPQLAETPLRKSLEIDPFNADARFSYGYAIWRRIDATQLNAMAAQWELALAINPLHFKTHWHWGNGHTNLTYADYAEKDDDTVRTLLQKADDEIRQNHVQKAIDITRLVEKNYPSSVLPLMYRGSNYYMAFDLDRKIRLDSAQSIFLHILARKKHYGPAHNGLAAVIKSKRIPFLASFDSINNALNHLKITDLNNFERVFSDVAYYPGNTVKSMVWNQMYAAVAYFPFLSKQNRTFHIPPLHIDLATSMNSSYFRYGTTFDNRQWMDIRGVGSGAADIGYVERGAFGERNVVLHEYVHLFHGTVLTDAECRQIRALYYNAMKDSRTLDYYSQNNESEYFAQTYPAYFEAVKVHPLDFKSMNTTADLKSKDPEMYQFIDQLVEKEKAFLNGNKKAMAGNWAQVYLNLSYQNRKGYNSLTRALLDTALSFDANYLPVYIRYADLEMAAKDFAKAENWLKKAVKIDKNYAPVYVAYARFVLSKENAGMISTSESMKEQSDYLKKAQFLEKDYQELAQVSTSLRQMYKDYGMIPEAIATADEYSKNGSVISTYLRDQRDDAIAFSAVLRSSLGCNETIPVLKNLVEQKPQNFGYRIFYADALANDNQYDKAVETLKEAQRILAASSNARPDYYLRIAEFYHLSGNNDSMQTYLQPFLVGKMNIQRNDNLRFIRLLIANNNKEKANNYFKKILSQGTTFDKADYYFTQGKLLALNGKDSESTDAYKKTIDLNPYLFDGYMELIKIYKKSNKSKEIADLKKTMNSLKLSPGRKYDFETDE